MRRGVPRRGGLERREEVMLHEDELLDLKWLKMIIAWSLGGLD